MNGIRILVKEALPSISLSSKLLHQSIEAEKSTRKDKNKGLETVVVLGSDDEIAKKKKEKKMNSNDGGKPEPPTEKPVAMASSSRDGASSSIKPEKVMEMMEKMIQVLETKKNDNEKQMRPLRQLGPL